jgi:hypothetical protein
MKKAIICDIDGTLAEKGDRNPFDYTTVDQDTLIVPVAETVKALAKYGYKILIFSGREDSCFTMTLRWLKRYQIPCDILRMRKTGDRRKDSIVKKEIFETVKNKYDIHFAIDDRNQMVDMYRKELNLPCFQVAYGDF